MLFDFQFILMNVQHRNDVRVLCKGELYLELCYSLTKSL
jgi:hypothetical protein